MNIHKHLRNLFLVSTALFWANCSNDSDISSPRNDAEGSSISSSSIESSSTAEESSSATETDSAQSSSAAEKTSSSAEETLPTEVVFKEKSSSSGNLNISKIINIRDQAEVVPDSCEPNRNGCNPSFGMSAEQLAEQSAHSRIQEFLSPDSGPADTISEESKECLKSILDTIQKPVMLYGPPSEITLDVKCSDGSTYYSQSLQIYAEQSKIAPEEAVQKSEQCDKDRERIKKKIDEQIDNCLDIKKSTEAVLCYNDTAKNAAGTSFDIIECDDGKKYLREPIVGVSESRLPLPEGVESTAPQPTESYAANCTPSSVCIDKVVLDEFGNPRNSGGCVPTTECPSRPEQ
ncbi:MAG: hypothetical protein II892_11545 [Fibrobacter sp.]|nr:hypothetical protein [Fibrobacter sp.]